ncbi:MAG: XRE family transcriptional regulator [Alcaligenaceae bacterium]|nr:XRE family transcriptional regulator [Alcaligenaceae bacterium SAGV5]MPS55179.1 XRE family transcriptional regulator [Alcaligenaceae bacterium SAGV3]MPT57870.1 XRE family transcriptional regulator [Alcaligenaceae bacterium]
MKRRHAMRIPEGEAVPHDVISLQAKNGWSLIQAWREYLEITQAEMATRLEVRQTTYANMEGPDARPHKAARERIAQALGISLDQLDD